MANRKLDKKLIDLVLSPTNRQGKLTITEALRATTLTKKITGFASFPELLDFYRDGSFRALMPRKAGPALLASWTRKEREAEETEHSLLLELANLVERAQGAKRRLVVQVRPTIKCPARVQAPC